MSLIHYSVVAYFQHIHFKTYYYMSESVFAMRLVNLRSATCCDGTKFAKKMLIWELYISLPRNKGLNRVIRRLSTLRTWMLALSFNI